MKSARATDVAVVGGGTIGLSIAWRLASEGAAVTVFDDAPGRGASWAAGGMLAAVMEAEFGEEPLLRLNLASRELWPRFAAALESASARAPGYRQSGTILVARDRDDLDELTVLHDFMMRLDLKVERLAARDLRDLEPSLSPRIRGGLLAPDDHRVDNRALVEALVAACERAGVEARSRRVVSLERSADRVVGVRLDDGERIPAGTTVLAAGAWSGGIEGLPAGTIPVRPVKGQILHLQGPEVPSLVTRVVRGLDVYLVPREGGRLVVGATAEERGFDTTVTAGGALHLLREAYELVPGVWELELVEIVAGLRPGTPDNAPLLGLGPLDGLVVATGHYRNGMLLTPVTADAIAELVRTGEPPEIIRPFAPTRFAGGAR